MSDDAPYDHETRTHENLNNIVKLYTVTGAEELQTLQNILETVPVNLYFLKEALNLRYGVNSSRSDVIADLDILAKLEEPGPNISWMRDNVGFDPDYFFPGLVDIPHPVLLFNGEQLERSFYAKFSEFPRLILPGYRQNVRIFQGDASAAILYPDEHDPQTLRYIEMHLSDFEL